MDVAVGLQLPSWSFPGGDPLIGPTLVQIAEQTEAAGFSSLWVMDHLLQLPEESGWGGVEEPMLEAYTTLGFLARATRRVRLGTLVGCATLRHPSLLVKAATTLDVLSGGRAVLGIGAGWYAREAGSLGIPFPDRSRRYEILEDTVRLARHAWSGDRTPFVGRTLTVPEPIVRPMPLRSGGPPILIGGGGERRTLRLVAELADACNILVPAPGESRHKLDVLRRHCEAIGRDESTIEKTSLIEIDVRPGRMRLGDIVAAIKAQAAEGIEHVILNLPDVHERRYLDLLGREVLPRVAEGRTVRSSPMTTAAP